MTHKKKLMIKLLLCSIVLHCAFAIEPNTKVVDSYDVIEKKLLKKEFDSISEYYAFPVEVRMKGWKKAVFASILPVYTINRGWVRSQFLKRGDEVLFLNEGKVEALPIRSVSVKDEMYVFYTYVNVRDTHTYFTQGVLVHNQVSHQTAGDAGNIQVADAIAASEHDETSNDSDNDNDNDNDNDETGSSLSEIDEKGQTDGAGESSVPSDFTESLEAQSFSTYAQVQTTMVEQNINDIVDISTNSENQYEQNINTTKDYMFANGAQQMGDPVLVSSGAFVLDECDVLLKGSISSFSFNRFFSSSNNILSSMGKGWSTILDSRIIRGTSENSSLYAQLLDKETSKLKELYDSLEKYKEYKIAEEARQRISGILFRTYFYNLTLLVDGNTVKAINELNSYVVTPNTPQKYYNIGNDNLTFIDEKGSPIIFKYASNGLWIPTDSKKAQYMKIISRDGKNSLSEAGFVLHDKGGVNLWFDKWGLLVKKVDKNGNEVVFNRNNDSKKVISIKTPEGRELKFDYNNRGLVKSISIPGQKTVRYGYIGNNLTSVIDMDGNKFFFDYNAKGLFTRYTKPDGSFVSIAYGQQNSNGDYLTTSTTNEEGYSEHFEYDLKHKATKYTSHSGFSEYVYYDNQHRTIKQVDEIGHVTTFTYDTIGNISSKSIQGNTIQYEYDVRGNKTIERYSDGSKKAWVYNSFDQVTSYTDRDGKNWRITYDRAGNATEFISANITVEKAHYDAKGNILQLIDYEGNVTSFGYDMYYNVTSKTVASVTEKFEYDELGNVVVYIDGANRRWEYEYGAKKIVHTSPSGLQRVYSLNNRKDITNIEEIDLITNEERVFDYHYDKRHLLQSISQDGTKLVSYTYYPAGEVKTITYGDKDSESWVTEYEYISGTSYRIHKKKLSSDKKQIGTIYTETYTIKDGGKTLEHLLPLHRKETLTFDSWNRLISVENFIGEKNERKLSPEGRILQEQTSFGGWYESVYNAQGLLSYSSEINEKGVEFSYNPNGTLASKTSQYGNKTQYKYNAQGLLIQESNEYGSIFYSYDAAGRPTQILLGKINSIQYAEQYTCVTYSNDSRSMFVDYGGIYNETFVLNAWGEVVQKIDGEKNVFTNTYNTFGQISTTIDAYSNVTEYKYNAIGKLSKIIYADNTEKTYVYNHVGFLEKVEDALGIQWQGYYDDACRLVGEEGRNLAKKNYVYDTLDRIVSVSIAGEVVEKYSYSDHGKKIVFTDGKENHYKHTLDDFGRLVLEEDRLGNSQHYAYDSAGQLIKHVDFNNNEHNVYLDEKQNSTTNQYADNSETVFKYDIAGRVIEAKNETGSIRYIYNKAGLLANQIDEGAGESIVYSYNMAGRKSCYVSGNRDVHYFYGKNGELLGVNDNFQRLSVKYTYDTMMRETSRTFANGIVQKTEYDEVGRTILITEVKSSGEIIRAEGYVYNEKGQICIKLDENALVTKYDYDMQGRLTTVYYPYNEEKSEDNKQEIAKSGLHLTSDMEHGEMLYLSTEEKKEASKLLDMVSYARANLLRNMQTVWKESYTYDKNSNLLSKTSAWGTIQYSYDDENRLIHSGLTGRGTSFAYDANGNLLSKSNPYQKEQFKYNGINRMETSIISDDIQNTKSITNYAYDAFGRRNMIQNEGFSTMRTLYDGLSHDIIKESEVFSNGSFASSSGSNFAYRFTESTSERYIFVQETLHDETYLNIGDYKNVSVRFTGTKTPLYAKGEIVGISYAENSNRNTLYFGKDVLGSVKTATQDYAELACRYEYDVFGNPYMGDFVSGLTHGYIGKPYEVETGLYNYGFRDYSPKEARFTTVDPIRDGSNWFSYVGNDPVNFIDLWGLSASDVGSWTNNGDGTYTAKAGAMLWELNSTGQNWTESDYVGKPENLQVGQTVSFNKLGTMSQSMTGNSSYGNAVSKLTAFDVPQSYDCADVALYIYGKASETSSGKDKSVDFYAGGYPLGNRPIPAVHSSDFAPMATNNVTYYRDSSGNTVTDFNNPYVKAGDIMAWVGHVATVTAVARDSGTVKSITILQGHLGGAPDVYTIKNQVDLNSFVGIFYGFAKINTK